jgi:hypothetical protein
MNFLNRGIVLIVLLAITGPVSAQSGSPDTASTAAQQPSTASDNSLKIAPGALIPAELVKSLDSKKVKEGDPVNAKVSMDLLSGGKIAIPRESKLVGHVTEAKARGKGESESTLGVVFDRLILKNGHEVPVHAIVQAVGAPLVSVAAGENERIASAGSPNVNAGGQFGGMPNPQMPRGSGSPQDSGPGDITRVQPLAPNATGVVGISGLTLRNTSSVSSVLASEKKNVKLDSGTQLLLRIASP